MTSKPAAGNRFVCKRIIERRERLARARVLTAGGANIEHSYRTTGPLQADAKYSIDPIPRLAGGSSVNHASRLLTMGIQVHPVLPLARVDAMSRPIVEALDRAADAGGARYRRSDLEIRGDGLTTPFSTIIRHGAERLVLNEFSPELMSRFHDHVSRHLEILDSGRRRTDVAAIGHIHADRAKPGRGAVGYGGEITSQILKARSLSSAKKFVNFGSAQVELGSKRWDRILRDHVDVFQLDIGEARRFCRDADLQDLSLQSILEWFRERCTVVISLERFGAVGQLAGSDHPVAAWPFLIDDVVDSTGAGDAMGAGIVASMLVDPFDDEEESIETRQIKFGSALAFGRVCGAYACTTVGGASDCPTLQDLAEFERRSTLHRHKDAPDRRVTSHELFLIDRAFDRVSDARVDG